MSDPEKTNDEIYNLRSRYERRKSIVKDRYSPINPFVVMSRQEKERAIIKLFDKVNIQNFSDIKVLEIGCGHGDNLLDLIRIGFQPNNLVGNELLDERAYVARQHLPESTAILSGDAKSISLPYSYFDIVMQSTVFTSILDHDYQAELAKKMWNMTKPGGGILWYDFTYNNPLNPDVRAVSLSRVQELFPKGKIFSRRVTLAPPIGRVVSAIYPKLYDLINMFPFLRSHILCWISKEK